MVNWYLTKYSYTDMESGKRKKAQILVQGQNLIEVDCAVAVNILEDEDKRIESVAIVPNVAYVEQPNELLQDRFFWRFDAESPTDDAGVVKETVFIYSKDVEQATEKANSFWAESNILSFSIVNAKKTTIETVLIGTAIEVEKSYA